MRIFSLLFFIGFWSINYFGQKVQIHYMVMDTLKNKNEFLEFVKSLEVQKEFAKINMSFYFVGKKEFNDSTWNNKKQVIKLFYSKIPCNSNLNQILTLEDNIINQLSSSTKNTLISTKNTFNEMDLNIPFDFQSNSMTSQLSLLEKLKELVKLKTDKDHHLLVIEKNFSFQTPNIILDTKSVAKNTTNQTIGFKTTTPFNVLNLGKGFSLNGPNSLKFSPETNTFSTLSYTDGLGCISNTDTLKIEIPKDCSCETLIGNFGITRSYLNTMNAVENKNTKVEYKWKISPQQNGSYIYCLIIEPKTECFDEIELEFKSNDEKTPMVSPKITIHKTDMTRLTDTEAWQIKIDLSLDYNFIKNPRVYSKVKITPIVNNVYCYNKSITERIKFSSCSINGDEE